MLKEDYKQKRSELDDILIEMNVPKHFYYTLAELNIYIYNRKTILSRCTKSFRFIT